MKVCIPLSTPIHPTPPPLQMRLTGWKLQGDRVQALGAAISGTVWVDKY